MATADEIQRIAAAMNALRPAWRIDSLVTFLTNHHAARAYRDLAIAAIAVTTDPRTQTPRLLNEHGPWWLAAQAAAGAVTDIRFARCQKPGHSSFPAANCASCRSEQLGRDDTPPPATDPDKAEAYRMGAENARRAIRHAPEQHDDTKENDR